MPTNVLTVSGVSFSGWSPTGVGATAGSGDNGIDGSDSTSLVPTSVATWNAVYVLPSNFAIDSYRVLTTGSLSWRLQTAPITPASDADFTTQASGLAGDSGLVTMPLAVSGRQFRLSCTIANTADRVFSFELYQGDRKSVV